LVIRAVFGPQAWQRRVGQPAVGIGNAVLIRWPIAGTKCRALPSGQGPAEGRSVLYAAAETPGGRLPFFTTQLTAHPALSSTRVEQVRALATIVAERSSGRPFPAVVTGDLNAEPDSDEVPLLCGHRTAPAAPGLVLVDAWRYADGGPGWTWDRRINTSPSLASPARASITSLSGYQSTAGAPFAGPGSPTPTLSAASDRPTTLPSWQNWPADTERRRPAMLGGGSEPSPIWWRT
jgi:hypothetical protein